MQHEPHQHQQIVYRLHTLLMLGALLSVCLGGYLLPRLLAELFSLLHVLPWWQHLPFYPFVAFPSVFLAVVWLAYYLITYRIGRRMTRPLMPSPDPLAPRGNSMVMARGWHNEQKEQLLHQCYQHFQNALQRYDPPKLSLFTPSHFYHYRDQNNPSKLTLYRIHGFPVIPEQLLTPERIHELLPLLAQHLYFYQDQHQGRERYEELNTFPSHMPLAPLLICTGNFLWIPVLYKNSLTITSPVRPNALSDEDMLNADTFAVALGQGPQLEHVLRLADEQAKWYSTQDTNIPPLTERIGHLEMLNRREREELHALGLDMQEPPMVNAETIKRLKEGR